MPELSSFNWFGSKNEQFSQFAHIFHRDQMCLASLTSPTLKLLTNLYLSDLIMPKPVFLMTVHEAPKEYNSLIDQIDQIQESVGQLAPQHLMLNAPNWHI